MKSLARSLLWMLGPQLFVYELILVWIGTAGEATMMLGATSGATASGLYAMGLALLLRLYLVVVAPVFVGYEVVRGAVRVMRARKSSPSRHDPSD